MAVQSTDAQLTRSGVGSGLAVADLNNDGAPELITSTKRGKFIFWNNWK